MRPRTAYLYSASIGVLTGLGAFTFHYAAGFSYFSSDPGACQNCHIMREPFDSWQKSAHRETATCVDCHLPHALLPKFVAKARNGYLHSKAFTLQDFHEPIRITPANARTLQENCVHCHRSLVSTVLEPAGIATEEFACVHCHADVGHGPVR